MQFCKRITYFQTLFKLRSMKTFNKLSEKKYIQIVVSKYQNITIPMVTSLFNQLSNWKVVHCRQFSTIPEGQEYIDSITFEKVCEETLDSLTEYFEELVEEVPHLKAADVQYSSGVLTVNFGTPYGTYVINRQSPNRQIWLSSPTSGPKRYDYILNTKCWIYKHDGKSLHKVLQDEVSAIAKKQVDFSKCLHSLIK